MILVLRLGHRTIRDKRISTHCALVARAFGADKILYSGERDLELEESVKKVVKKWGDNFAIEYVKNWKKVLMSFSGKKIHLTMYGIPLTERVKDIRKLKDIMVIIGGEKVPYEVYKLSDMNISVTNQPHSEVAALAVFLHEYYEGREFKHTFSGAKVRIIPQEKGKNLVKL